MPKPRDLKLKQLVSRLNAQRKLHRQAVAEIDQTFRKMAHIIFRVCQHNGITTSRSLKVPHLESKGGRKLSPAQVTSVLTRTEREILGYLKLDVTERQIADELKRSPHTVHVHVKNIYQKLNTSSRQELLDLIGQESDG